MKAVVRFGAEKLVLDDGVLEPYRAELAELDAQRTAPPVRRAWAATHVVMRDRYATVEHGPSSPGTPEELSSHVDWRATASLRRRLDRLGFGVAEAMDTAQRFEIGWTGAKRLIEATGALGLSQPFVAGASTDHLAEVRSKADLVEGVLEQV